VKFQILKGFHVSRIIRPDRVREVHKGDLKRIAELLTLVEHNAGDLQDQIDARKYIDLLRGMFEE
jgi:hypothetical protein